MTGYFAYERGNRIWYEPGPIAAMDDDEFHLFMDTRTEAEVDAALLAERTPHLPCATCHAKPIERDDFWADDACIRELPGVRYACCGHGILEEGHDRCYVGFEDGLVLYGNAARWAMAMLGGTPPPAPEGAPLRAWEAIVTWLQHEDELADSLEEPA